MSFFDDLLLKYEKIRVLQVVFVNYQILDMVMFRFNCVSSHINVNNITSKQVFELVNRISFKCSIKMKQRTIASMMTSKFH